MTLTAEQQALKSEVIRLRGYWHKFHDGLLRWSPSFLRAYLGFQSAPWRSNHIEPKVREFIYIAVDGAVTHLYQSGLRRHMDDALALGATPDEVLQVVLLTASAAAHGTHELAFAILAEELPEAAAPLLSPAMARMKQAYIAATGGWPAAGDAVAVAAPDFADSFLAYRQAAWEAGPLPARIKELILMAVYAAPTLLNADGVRRHMRSAIAHGATAGEISDILQLASAIAVHTCTYGVPALMDAVEDREAKTGKQ